MIEYKHYGVRFALKKHRYSALRGAWCTRNDAKKTRTLMSLLGKNICLRTVRGDVSRYSR